jgi:membrane protease YdiL (CAAX protease family)
MSQSVDTHRTQAKQAQPAEAVALPQGWLARWPWVTFVLPLAVFMAMGSLEPTPPKQQTTSAQADDSDASSESQGAVPYKAYPLVYSAKIALTVLAMLLVLPGYRTFPWRMSGLSIVVGVVGVLLWIGLCHLRLEPKMLGPVDRFLGSLIPGLEPGDTPTIGLLGLLGTGERSAFNPLVQMADQPALAWAFLAIRFFGLALVVPVIEEFFLRGFLMRFVHHQQWWQVPFGWVDGSALLVGTIVPMLMHPGELLAAAVWFSIVTWLMLRTRNIWDCVAAHAVTNLLLGLYVVLFDQWQLM